MADLEFNVEEFEKEHQDLDTERTVEEQVILDEYGPIMIGTYSDIIQGMIETDEQVIEHVMGMKGQSIANADLNLLPAPEDAKVEVDHNEQGLLKAEYDRLMETRKAVIDNARQAVKDAVKRRDQEFAESNITISGLRTLLQEAVAVPKPDRPFKTK